MAAPDKAGLLRSAVHGFLPSPADVTCLSLEACRQSLLEGIFFPNGNRLSLITLRIPVRGTGIH